MRNPLFECIDVDRGTECKTYEGIFAYNEEILVSSDGDMYCTACYEEVDESNDE